MWGPAKIWPTFTLLKWWKSWKVRNAINADCRRTIYEISEITGLSWSSCQRMLMEDLNLKHVSTKFIHWLLTEDQKNNCLNVHYDLKEQVGNDPQILSKVVTGDETWCYGYNPETKQALSQWKTPNSPRAKTARQVRSNVKIMLISFLMLMELCTRNLFLLHKLWINNFIWRCWKDYMILYRKNDQKCGVALIGSFTTTMPLPTQPWVCSSLWQKNMTVIPHSPYSPNLVPCNFFLFPRMKGQMKGKCFADVIEVKKKTLEVLNNISTEEIQKCFQQWGKCWDKCIESKGDYFEGD